MQKAIKKIRKNLDEIEEDMKRFPPIKKAIITSAASDHVNYRATGPCVDVEKVIGREEDKKKIVDLLLRPSTDPKKIPVLSIVGIGGMGKTTIAQLLYKDESWQESCRFDLKIWVPDSKKFNVKCLLKNILKSISPNDTSVDTLDDNHLKQRFEDRIGGKSFFLVLDDVESEDPIIWKQLESLLNDGNRRESRILVTTRSRKVANVMGLDSLYELHGLSETDALQLFETYAFPRGRVEDLVEIGKLCVEKCLGVPLAVQVIGSLLHDVKDKHQWERVRKDIDLAIKDESNQIIPILMISYYNLDSALKQCFSYCALFPKNYHISKKILSSIWRVNVRLENEGGLLEDDCEKNLKTLCDRCLLEEDEAEDGCFKMHDLMHDLANNVAGEEMLVVNSNALDSNKLILKENVRHVNFMWDAIKYGEFSSFKIQGRRLRTFLQPGCPSYMVPWMNFSTDEFVLGCPVLRILDIHSWGIGKLTSSIGKLIHLRYLDLSCNEFQTLPNSIVELINLRHLNLAQCKYLTHLPYGMGALTSLEVLDISNGYKLVELPVGIEMLIELKHLNITGCRSLTHMPSEIGALTSLELLDISDCKKLEELPVSIEKLTKLKHLMLRCTSFTHMPNGMGSLTSLEILDISGCNELKELPKGVVRLINLKCLMFDGCTSLANLPAGIGALKSRCRFDRFIVGDPESSHSAQFEELSLLSGSTVEKLKIELPNITIKDFLDGEEFLLNNERLRELEIKWQGNPKEKVGSNHIDILAKLQPPPNLRNFHLDGYQGMTFPPWLLSVNGFTSVLPNLKMISISNCGKCQHLPPLSGLPCLEYLELRGLSNLVYIEENVSAASFCPSLKELTLYDLPELKGWCRGTATGADDDGKHKEPLILPSFPIFHHLRIQSCPNLTVAPMLSFINEFSSSVNLLVQVCTDGGGFHLSLSGDFHLEISDWDASGSQSINIMVDSFREMSENLEVLRISNCPGLKTIPGLQHITDLQGLLIKKCCDFTGEKDGQVSWKELQCLILLSFIELPKLERLPEGIQFLTSLKYLDCENCCEFTGEIEGQVSWKDLQNLKELSFTQLPKMERLPEGIQFLTSLQKIRIHQCDNLLLPEWLHKTFKYQTTNGEYSRFNGIF